MNVKTFLKNRGISLDNCMKTSDLPKDVRGFTMTITDVKPAPEAWNSPLVICFKPEFDSVLPDRGRISQMALNKTNVKFLMENCGDETSEWIGREIRAKKVVYEANDKRSEEWEGFVLELPKSKK